MVDFNAFPDTCIQYHEYIDLLRARRTFIQGVVDIFCEKQVQDHAKVQNANQRLHKYARGDLVAVLAPTAAALAMNSQKCRRDYVGPLVIDTVVDTTHFKL